MVNTKYALRLLMHNSSAGGKRRYSLQMRDVYQKKVKLICTFRIMVKQNILIKLPIPKSLRAALVLLSAHF